MRIKVGDPGSHDVEVYLNGAKQEECVFADDELGIIHVIERHWRTGEIVERPDSPYGGTGFVEVKGKVEIRGLDAQAGTFSNLDLLDMMAQLVPENYLPALTPGWKKGVEDITTEGALQRLIDEEPYSYKVISVAPLTLKGRPIEPVGELPPIQGEPGREFFELPKGRILFQNGSSIAGDPVSSGTHVTGSSPRFEILREDLEEDLPDWFLTRPTKSPAGLTEALEQELRDLYDQLS